MLKAVAAIGSARVGDLDCEDPAVRQVDRARVRARSVRENEVQEARLPVLRPDLDPRFSVSMDLELYSPDVHADRGDPHGLGERAPVAGREHGLPTVLGPDLQDDEGCAVRDAVRRRDLDPLVQLSLNVTPRKGGCREHDRERHGQREESPHCLLLVSSSFLI